MILKEKSHNKSLQKNNPYQWTDHFTSKNHWQIISPSALWTESSIIFQNKEKWRWRIDCKAILKKASQIFNKKKNTPFHIVFWKNEFARFRKESIVPLTFTPSVEKRLKKRTCMKIKKSIQNIKIVSYQSVSVSMFYFSQTKKSWFHVILCSRNFLLPFFLRKRKKKKKKASLIKHDRDYKMLP